MSCRLQRNSRNSGGVTFFGGDGLSLIFRSPLLTVFKSFIPFNNCFAKRTRHNDASKQRSKIGDG